MISRIAGWREQVFHTSLWNTSFLRVNQPLAVGLIVALFMVSLTFWKVTPVLMIVAPNPNSSGTESNSSATELPQQCPSWFGKIDNDLAPWRDSGGIDRALLESASGYAYFRVVVVAGSVYVEQYKDAFNYRFNFTMWGLLMLIRRHPGLVPDVELLFSVDDLGAIPKHGQWGATSSPLHHLHPPPPPPPRPPPLIQYSHDDDHYAILWPDWSFWGWPEVEVREWGSKCADIAEGGKRAGPWASRIGRAFWKGNARTGRRRNKGLRAHIIACSQSPNYTSSIDAYALNWANTTPQETRLEDQCTHRYRIYAEGNSWSVSLKYGLCCGSALLLIHPFFQDFYSRALVPWHHYIPISRDGLCDKLKEAVEWGNTNPEAAQKIANAGQHFALKELGMDVVYDYMLEMLKRYARLLHFHPQVTSNMLKLTEQTFLDPAAALAATSPNVALQPPLPPYYSLVKHTQPQPCVMPTSPTPL